MLVQCKKEVRNSQAKEADHRPEVVAERVLMNGRVQTYREGDDPREDQRGERHHDGKEEALAEDLRHREVQHQRVAKVASEESADPT